MKKEFDHKTDWFYEGQVSAKIVGYLKTQNYQILKDNSKNIKQREVDIIAISPSGNTELIEVKGFPSTNHVKGAKKGEEKKTRPKDQANHWFSEAITDSVYNYGEQSTNYKNIVLAIGLPVDNQYKMLINKVEKYFTDNNTNFKVYLVDKDGNVTVDNLNSTK